MAGGSVPLGITSTLTESILRLGRELALSLEAAPQRRFHPQGRRGSTEHDSHGRLHRQRFASRLATRTPSNAEAPAVPSSLDKLAGYGISPAVCIADRGYDVSVYNPREARGIRPVCPLKETPFREGGQGRTPRVRARNVDLRRFRRQARRSQVPLPLGRVLPGERVDQGRPAAHAHPAWRCTPT